MKFRRQHPIAPYIVDFYCAETRLIIEVDGPVHGGRKGPSHGRGRFEQSSNRVRAPPAQKPSNLTATKGDSMNDVNTNSKPSELKITDMRMARLDNCPMRSNLIRLATEGLDYVSVWPYTVGRPAGPAWPTPGRDSAVIIGISASGPEVMEIVDSQIRRKRLHLHRQVVEISK